MIHEIKSRFNVLFLCTANSARSILSEAILRHEGGLRFQSFSAGSKPSGNVNPVALRVLETHGISTTGLSSKSWHVFDDINAQKMDFIFTACGNARDEECPLWPGHPTTAHWGVPDPAGIGENDAEQLAAFEQAYNLLRKRIKLFINLPLENMPTTERQEACIRIGEIV